MSILSLKAGDLVDIVAPSSRCPDAELKAGCQFLEELGLKVRAPSDLFSDHPYLASSDEVRWTHLRRALLARDSKAIWCARGGYGATRLMPDLMKLKKPAHSKALIGLSDITALHIWVNTKWKWPSWHAPILSRLGSDRASGIERTELQSILNGHTGRIAFENLEPLNKIARTFCRSRRPHELTVPQLVGGNLALIAAGLGTGWEIRTKGRFLFLEDAGERGYQIDRMLHHLQQAGIFEGVQGVFLGDFTGGDEQSGENFVSWTLERFFEKLAYVPAWRGIQSGHGPIQRPIPLGMRTTLVGQNGAATLHFKI